MAGDKCDCRPEECCPVCDAEQWLHETNREMSRMRREFHRLRQRAIELAVAVETVRDWSGTPVGEALFWLNEWRPRR